jgi:hypothetical protein
MEYGLPGGRRLYHASLGQPSVVTRFLEARRNAEATPQALAECARALDILFRVLLAFRGRHAVIAKTSYAEPIRINEAGSAGYDVDTLLHLLQLTKGAWQQVLSSSPAPSHEGWAPCTVASLG